MKGEALETLAQCPSGDYRFPYRVRSSPFRTLYGALRWKGVYKLDLNCFTTIVCTDLFDKTRAQLRGGRQGWVKEDKEEKEEEEEEQEKDKGGGRTAFLFFVLLHFSLSLSVLSSFANRFVSCLSSSHKVSFFFASFCSSSLRAYSYSPFPAAFRFLLTLRRRRAGTHIVTRRVDKFAQRNSAGGLK